jgi:hypothetical protein
MYWPVNHALKVTGAAGDEWWLAHLRLLTFDWISMLLERRRGCIDNFQSNGQKSVT